MTTMKIIKIVVDELPTNCGECELSIGNYCKVKGLHTESRQEWIDKYKHERHPYCPLKAKRFNMLKSLFI